MAKDPYKLLGLTKSASEKDIRKAYRALAKKYHPDVNPDNPKIAEKFKEISAAYTLLSDKKLKSQYDRGHIDGQGQQRSPFGAGGFGSQGFGTQGFGGTGGRTAGGGHMRGGDMNDLLQSLFGMQMGGAQMGSMQQPRQRPQKGKDKRYRLKLTLFEALRGGSRKIKAATGTSFSVKIPAAIEDGQSLRLRGKGQAGLHGGAAGDAKVDIEILPDKYFSREGKNLRLNLPISLREALLGAKVKIPMPDGYIQMNIPPGTNSGTILRLRGKGVGEGDLLVAPQIVLKDMSDPELIEWAKQPPSEADFNPRSGMTEAGN